MPVASGLVRSSAVAGRRGGRRSAPWGRTAALQPPESAAPHPNSPSAACQPASVVRHIGRTPSAVSAALSSRTPCAPVASAVRHPPEPKFTRTPAQMPANESPKQFPETSPATSEGVRAWLTSAVAEAAGLAPSAVTAERPLAEFGLGSRQLVALAAGLAEWTGRSLEPSLVFDHPTIEGIAEAVLDEQPRGTAGPATVSAPSRPVRAQGRRHRDHLHGLPVPRRRR